MKVAITGHKNGLGKELADWFVGSKDEVVGFDKEDGFDANNLTMNDIVNCYSASKKMLDELSDRSIFYGYCKTHNIKLGYMDTSFAKHLKKQEDALDVSEASRLIYEVITHKYYIPTIGIMAKKN